MDDEDDQAEADEERQSEEDARLALCDVAAALMETHKEAFVQAGFQPFTSLFMTLLSQKEDETLPLSMASAMLQHLGDACAQAFPTFVPRVLEGITHAREPVRKLAAEAVASGAPSAGFAPFAGPAAAKLAQTISSPEAKKKKAKEATEAAVHALGLLCYHHAAQVESVENVWGMWLDCFPVSLDALNQMLCRLVGERH